MMLSDGQTAVTLSDDLLLQQPYWQPVAQAVTYTLSGSMIVDESVRQAGKPLVFQSEEQTGWVPRSVVDQLQRWAERPGQRLTLDRYGSSTQVIFDRQDGPALEARPVLELARAPEPEDWMLITLRLMTT